MNKLLPPKVKKKYYNAEFWIEKISDPKKILLKKDDISTLNIETCKKMKTANMENQYQIFSEIPDKMSKEEIEKRLEPYSSKEDFPVGEFFDKNGEVISEEKKSTIIENANLDKIKSSEDLKYAMTVRRTSLRAFPTKTVFARKRKYIDSDLMQLTAISPAEPVTILHKSRDCRWVFVQSTIYAGWLKKADIALAENKEIIEEYLNKKYLLVTESRVSTEPDPFWEDGHQIEFQMGDKIRLAEHNNGCALMESNLHSQADTGSYAVTVPQKDEAGQLYFQKVLLASSAGIIEGLLPYTRSNILRQAFKMMGERYGWGGMFNRRDCSRFVMDVYKTFGIKLPRDAGPAQEENAAGRKVIFNGSIEERREILQLIQPGDVIYMPGHVVIYIGEDEGNHFIIHAGAGYAIEESEGEYKDMSAHSVFICDLEQELMKKQGKKYLEYFTSARKFY